MTGRKASAKLDLRTRAVALAPRVWLGRELQALVSALGHLSKTPLSSCMTIAVIAIALALPATLYVFLENVARIGGVSESPAGLSVFLAPDAGSRGAARFARELQARREVETVLILSPNEALADYLALGGEPGTLDSLGGQNPFPWVLALELRGAHGNAEAAADLAAELNADPAVERVVFDQAWMQRLLAVMALARRGAGVLAVLLGVGVVLVVGNTIRLEVQARTDEIAILRLFGATNSFVRRPFLWAGLWYGGLGGLLALGIVVVELEILKEPVEALISEYGGRFVLSSMLVQTAAGVLVAGLSLGWVGAWLAASRYLYRKIGEME
ncbi:MAG: permease-like cell division protein FtsX [Pseudomonadota bacterium]